MKFFISLFPIIINFFQIKMIINSILAFFIALFFWKNANKEIEEKTQKASKLRTSFFLILSIIVSIFYYKTYQVATINNLVGVDGLRCSIYKGEFIDTLEVSIHNKLFHRGSYKNDIKEFCDNNIQEKEVEDNGGVVVNIFSHVNPDSIFTKTFESTEYLTYDSLIKINRFFPLFQHLYKVNILTTSIPNLIPFEPEFNINSGWEKIGENSFKRIKKYSHRKGDSPSVTAGMTNKFEVPKNYFGTPYFHESYIGSYNIKEEEKNKHVLLKTFMCGYNLNSLNIFSAADISQITYSLSIDSKIPVGIIEVNYDVPIELSTHASFIDEGVYSFIIHGGSFEDNNWDFNKASTLDFHVKFPTMANLQLIRSFILTLLLSALFSLFFKNLYYLVRKFFISKKNLLFSLINEHAVNKIRNFGEIISVFLIILSGLYIYIIWSDKSVLIPLWLADNFLWIILCLIILMFIVIVFIILFIIKPLKKD